MTKRESPIEESRARELLQRERERIESALADLERTRRSELDEIDTSTDPVEDGELIQETEVDDALRHQLRTQLEAIERADAAARGRHVRILGRERRADSGRPAGDGSLGGAHPGGAGALRTLAWAGAVASSPAAYVSTDRMIFPRACPDR